MSITFSKRKLGGTNLLFLSTIFRLFIQIWTLIKNILLHQCAKTTFFVQKSVSFAISRFVILVPKNNKRNLNFTATNQTLKKSTISKPKM